MLVAALAAGAVAQGGYYPPGRVLVTALVAVALLLSPLVRRPARADAWPVPVACALLALWTLVPATVAGEYRASLAAVATLGCVAAVVVLLRRTGPAARAWCADAAIGLGVLVALTAWIGVAWRVPRFAELVEHKLWRGGSTLTYPNAAAALLVPLALLALALLVARPRAAGRAVAAYLLLVGVGAALSRAGLIALAAGLVVLAVCLAGSGGVRVTAWHAAAPVLGAGIAVGALAPSFPASGPAHPALALAGLVAGAAVAMGAVLVPARIRAFGLAVALVAAGAAVATQVRSGTVQAVLASRGNLDSSGRTGAFQAALDLVREHPLIGSGIGEARFLWLNARGTGQAAIYAHDEYLQVLVDLGAIGFALLLALAVAIVAHVRRGRGYPHLPGIRAGAIAALAAFAVHSGFDFLWHIAVLPLAGALFVGLAGPATVEEPGGPATGRDPITEGEE